MSKQKFCGRCKWAMFGGGNCYRGPQVFCTRYAPKDSFPEVTPETVCGDFELQETEPMDAWLKSFYHGKTRRVPEAGDEGSLADMEGTSVRIVAFEDGWIIYLVEGVRHSVGIKPKHCFSVELERSTK